MLISVIILVSYIVLSSPVDPARLTFGQRLDESALLVKKQELRLDKPVSSQIMAYLADISPLMISQSDFKNVLIKIPLGVSDIQLKWPYFRFSYQSGRSVLSLVMDALPKTLILAFTSILLAVIVGIGLGLLSALNKGKFLDGILLTLSTLGISLPSYVTAMIFALVFGFILKDFTGLNIQGSIFELNDIGDPVIVWKNLILPSLALGIRPVAIFTQLSRAIFIDIFKMDYIKTAKAKGMEFSEIVKKHVFRNSANPLATSISGWFASLLAGAFFVEYVFNFKGIGSLTINALLQYDVPVLLACLIFVSTVFILINLTMEWVYRRIDPRIR